MLESVAKTKWCPFAGAVSGDCNCIGTGCMMFQVTVEGGTQDVVHLDSPSRSFTSKVVRETEGYCGLARRS